MLVKLYAPLKEVVRFTRNGGGLSAFIFPTTGANHVEVQVDTDKYLLIESQRDERAVSVHQRQEIINRQRDERSQGR